MLDPTCGSGGKVTTDLFPGTEIASRVAIQPDGGIVVGGSTSSGFAIARYDSNGSLEGAFHSYGAVSTANQRGWVNAIAIQDGKILVAGSVGSGQVLVRLNSNLTLDKTFDDDGIVDTVATNFIVQDGKIVLAGPSSSGVDVVQLNDNGSRDETFGENGYIHVDTSLFVRSLALQDDKLILAGEVGAGPDRLGPDSKLAVTRLNADGTVDATFGVAGQSTVDFDYAMDLGMKVAVDPDGKIIVAGATTNFILEDSGAVFQSGGMAAVRLSPNGNLVTITDRAEQEFLNAAFLKKRPDGTYPVYWIGLQTSDETGLYRWASGEPLHYVNWNHGEPNRLNGLKKLRS